MKISEIRREQLSNAPSVVHPDITTGAYCSLPSTRLSSFFPALSSYSYPLSCSSPFPSSLSLVPILILLLSCPSFHSHPLSVLYQLRPIPRRGPGCPRTWCSLPSTHSRPMSAYASAASSPCTRSSCASILSSARCGYYSDGERETLFVGTREREGERENRCSWGRERERERERRTVRLDLAAVLLTSFILYRSSLLCHPLLSSLAPFTSLHCIIPVISLAL